MFKIETKLNVKDMLNNTVKINVYYYNNGLIQRVESGRVTRRKSSDQERREAHKWQMRGMRWSATTFVS